MTRCNRHDLRDRDLDQRTVFTDQLNEKQPHMRDIMAEKTVKKLPPCPWPDNKAPYTIHRVVIPRKLSHGGYWMEDRW